MAYNINRLLELLGPQLQQDPEVKAMTAALGRNPKLADSVGRMLYSMVLREGGDPDDPGAFSIIKQLPTCDCLLGTVTNGRLDGPVFGLSTGTAENLSHVGLFGLPRWGKTTIMKAIALDAILKRCPVWIFDVEDEFSCLLGTIDEPYKPITITPEHLLINFFQPPGDWIGVKEWRESIAFLLRGEMFMRDGSQNLFNASLNQLLISKGAFAGSNQFPSLNETLSYLQSYQLSGSAKRNKEWLETLINRLQMLVNTYGETARVTNSNMLQSLVTKPVIFRLRNKRGIPLQFLVNFLLMWLESYKQGETVDKKILTLFIDEQHLFRADKIRNDIGSSALLTLFATGAKRGIRIVLSNQLISRLNAEILGNMGCRIITRLTNPKDKWLIQQSMGLSREQTESITQLEKREVIVSYGDYSLPFKVRVNEFTFPAKPDEMTLEKNAQDFLDRIKWTKDAGVSTEPAGPQLLVGDALRVFTRIAQKVESIDERCEALKIDRSRESRARKTLQAKGYIAREEVTVGNRMQLFGLTPKGETIAEKLKIRIKRFKSGRIHEYLLNQVEKKIGLLNPRFTFQRNSQITREHGIQPDSVLNMSSDNRAIIQIICGNVDREAKVLNRLRTIPQVDMIIAVAANKRIEKALQKALEDDLFQEHSENELAHLAVLDGGTCLDSKFDWVSVFEQP